MPDFWSDEYKIKAVEQGIHRYRMDENIHIVASEGNMRREAIDAWADMIREVVDSIEPKAPMFIVIDLSAPSQGFTPYGGSISRQLLQYVVDKREARSYIAMVLSDSVINMIISTFFQRVLSHTSYPRQAFTKPDEALAWIRQQVQDEANKSEE